MRLEEVFRLAAQGTIRFCRFGQDFHRVPPALCAVLQNVLFPVTAFEILADYTRSA